MKRLIATLADDLARSIFPEISTGCELGSSQFTYARIYLHGDLGAGKTSLHAPSSAIGVTGRIKSPTYTLLGKAIMFLDYTYIT